jgi:hypothetical protein
MVLQGANDPRVLQVESDDIVAAARKNGVPVEYIRVHGRGSRICEEGEHPGSVIATSTDRRVRIQECSEKIRLRARRSGIVQIWEQRSQRK